MVDWAISALSVITSGNQSIISLILDINSFLPNSSISSKQKLKDALKTMCIKKNLSKKKNTTVL